MEYSMILARFWGFLFIILGIIFLKKNEIFKLIKDRLFMIFSGYLALILGLVTVILNNLWVTDWRLAITLIGWISLIKGIVRIGFPEYCSIGVNALKKNTIMIKPMLIVTILLGIWLVWMTF